MQRADALAREVEDLRREKEELAAERDEAREKEQIAAEREEAATEARRELEELARRKESAPRAPARSKREPRYPKTEADKRVDTALSHAWWMGPVMVAPMLGTPVVLVALLGTAGLPVWVVMGLFLGTGLSMVALLVGQRLLAAYERRRLAKLPFELPDYLEYLGRIHAASTTMTVTVDVDAPPGDACKVIADAVVGAMRDASAAFDGDRLVIRSPSIYARFGRKRGSPRTTPQNHLLHAWFKKLVRRAIMPITRAYPVRSVTVR